MCGIAGVYYFNPQEAERFRSHEQVLKALVHRGPDHSQHGSFASAELYHSRLMILDLSEAGHQPMQDERKEKALVFNGEIFNYRELTAANMPLRSESDAEVLLHMLGAKGPSALPSLNGFFAFAYLDQPRNELLLGRDRLGIKPLYYLQQEQKLYFASELRALLVMAGPQELNPEQVYTYFRLNYCAGEERIFKHVKQLPPGHYLRAGAAGLEVTPWYKYSPVPSNGDLSGILEDAVRLRLHADVPVGSFLSGGLDSSIISAIAAKQQPGLKTFSIGFKDHPFLDESPYAERMARFIGSDHHALRLKEEDFLSRIEDFLARVDEPFADSSAFNLFLLSEYSRKHVKAVLSGDGADELFKGYHKHKALVWSRHPLLKFGGNLLASATSAWPVSREASLANRIRQVRKFAELSGMSSTEKIEHLASIRSHAECHRLLKAFQDRPTCFTDLFKAKGSFSALADEERFDLQVVLAEDMLVKTDRYSMCHGLELRNPFLDYRLVEHALHLEQGEKISVYKQKIALRKHFAHLLPNEILKRGKKGFELPLLSWLRGALKSKLEQDWLNAERIQDEGHLDAKEVQALKQQLFSRQPGDSAAKVWALIIFEQWYRAYKPFIRNHA